MDHLVLHKELQRGQDPFHRSLSTPIMHWPHLSHSSRDDSAIPINRRGTKIADTASPFLSTSPSALSSTTADSPSSPPPPYEALQFTASSFSTDDVPESPPRLLSDGRSSVPDLSLLGRNRIAEQGSYSPHEVANTYIPHLREALNSLDTKMASLMSQRHELETHLEQAVRLQAPVQRLPGELLSCIFVVGVCDTEDEEPLLVSTLMLVCRYWKDVVVNTPELWSNVAVSTHDSLEKASRKLARSKSVPLDITINFSPRAEHASGVTENVIHAMDLIRPALWRARSLRLSVPNRPQAHAALLRCQEDAPLLESLSIRIFHSMQEDHYSSPRLPLFNGHTPRLRSCSFTSFNFGWDTRVVSGLRVLQLCGYWNRFSPSVEIILDILRGCPGLEELALRNMSDIEQESLPFEQEFATTKVLQLPRLRKASFYYAGIMRTRMLLSQISFPMLESLDFCYLDNLTPVLEHLRQQSLTSLPLRYLRVESSFFNEQKFVILLRRLTSLVNLELIDMEDVTCYLLKNLSTPPTAHPWICPKLETLNLDGCTGLEWDALRGFIESRLSGRSSSRYQHASLSSTSVPRSTSTASASAHIHALAFSRANSPVPLSSPYRLRSIDVTRCHQISKEMVQWLRMYVSDVKCEPAKGVWGEPVLP